MLQQKPRREVIVRLADYILANKYEIIERWSRAVYNEKEIKSADNLTYAQLIDHLPKILNEISCLLKQRCNEEFKTELEHKAREHGVQRWQQGYDLDELLREFGLLRVILSEYITRFEKENHDLTPNLEFEARKIITEFLNDSSVASAQQFAKERELEARHYREELEAANKRLEEKNARLKELYDSRLIFTRTASHELRNVLSAISGATRILSKNVNEATHQEMIAILKRSISDMETLIDQLLDYSRLIAGQEQIKIETFDLSHLLSEIVAAFSLMAIAKGLDLEIEIDPTLQQIESDRLKIKRIVNNLLSNAIKYTLSGRVKLSASSRDSDHFTIVVEDTGPGIEPENLERIFEEFQRGASSAGVRGSGLGLTITRRLVEILDGQISLTSELGRGSRFEITLPRNGGRERE